jgi:hypothetical protein
MAYFDGTAAGESARWLSDCAGRVPGLCELVNKLGAPTSTHHPGNRSAAEVISASAVIPAERSENRDLLTGAAVI